MFILSIIFLIVGIALLFLRKKLEDMPPFVPPVPIILGIGLLLWSFVTVIPNGEVGIPVVFGEASSSTLASGLNFVNPMANIVKMNVQTQNYTMSAKADEGKKAGDDAVEVQGNDGMHVSVEVSVLYHLDPNKAAHMYKNVGEDYEEKIVRAEVRSVLRDMAPRFAGIDLYTSANGEREKYHELVYQGLASVFQKRDLVLENVLVRQIDAPKSIKDAIEAKKQAQQNAEKMEFTLQQEKMEAQRKAIEAEGIRNYQDRVSSGATQAVLEWKAIEAMKELAESPNAKVIVIGGKNGIPTMLPLGDLK